jgi:uncharacterized cupredoxin-like copper-binding protein
MALLLGLAGCAGHGEPPPAPATALPAGDVDWSGAQVIDVTLVDFSFEPDRIVLEHGRPYLLRLANRGTAGHDFSAPAFFQEAVVGDGAVAAEAREGAVEVARGATVELHVMPKRAGTYPLECTHLLHADIFGMTGTVEVR